jgi:aryl-alcohol dehydrogenase-like predicted oxidoreductase
MVERNRERIFLVTKSGGRSYDAFMRDVDESLRLLRTDHIDLLHIWNLPATADLDEIGKGAFRAVRKLKDEKVVSHHGVTGHSGAAILMRAMKRFDPDAVLTVFPCTRDDNGRYEDELLPLARERNMGVIAMKTVRHARNADLKGSDLIRYALSLDGIHSAIVGLDTIAHLRENMEMATAFRPMPADERAQLHQDAIRDLAGIPTPWEQPGYRDGTPA